MKKIITAILFILVFSMTANAQLLDALFGGSGKANKAKVKFIEGNDEADEEILLINLKGVIQEKEDEGKMLLKPQKNVIEEITKDLDLANKRKSIKAILLEINSPGGEVTCCDIITHKLKKFTKETGKPIVVLIGSMGCSGGYYISCAAQKILAQPTAIIGSIGVIMQSMNVEKLAELIGVKPITIKSEKTPLKDILSPFREMTSEEKEMLMSIINSMYDRFVNIVAEGRKMDKETVIKLANGGIYTPEQAMEYGLIDDIGYREDAMSTICKLCGLESAALVKRIEKRGLSDLLGEFAEIKSGVPAVMEKLESIKYGLPTTFLFK